MTDRNETRRRSAILFGNEKVVEVVLALKDREAPTHALEVALELQVAQQTVGPVLRRLADLGVISALPRASRRAAHLYEPNVGDGAWESLVHLCEVLAEGETLF